MAEFNQSPQDQFDAKVRQELRGIQPPADLRQRILEGQKAHRPRNLVPVSFRHWFALAACLGLIAGIVWLNNRPPGEDRTFAGFQNRMTAFAVRQYSMDVLTNDLAAVRNYLSVKQAPSDFELRGPLATAPIMGGAKLAWQGQPVAMVCFRGPKDKTLYLFVIETTALGQAPGEPVQSTLKGLSTAAWNIRGSTYLLAAEIPSSELREFL